MALELLTHYRKDISELKLVPSGGGAFEVSVNGKLIFSKLEEGRFPEPKELKESIEAA
jgi:selenoprotein W-related protein